jgi:predicted dehydrogenase
MSDLRSDPLRVACIGMGWWSDVLADAIKRSGKLSIVACYTRSEDKRVLLLTSTAAGRPRATRKSWLILGSKRSSTPRRTTCTFRPPALRPRPACRKVGVVLALGYQRRRESHFRWVKQQIEVGTFGKLVNAEANISRDRLGGATRPPACRAALCSKSASTTPTCWSI